MSGLTHEHDLLLRAALLPGVYAIDAWTEWRASSDLDRLDADSQWLLPLLDHHLRTLGVANGSLVRYHNVYRHNWYKNQLLLKQAEKVLHDVWRQLDPACDSPPLLLGGAAMALAHYDAIGARPFDAVEASLPPFLTRSDTTPCVFRTLLFSEREEAVRERAIPVRWKTLRVLTLDPADQLLDLCLRREHWDRRSRLLWFADVVTLLHRHPDVTWTDAAVRAQRIGRLTAVSHARQLVDDWRNAAIAA